jgi:hypothetical protein
MRTHRLTTVQRRVLRWMKESEYVVRIETGFKTTTLHVAASGESIIRCQTLVPYFLKRNGYIEEADGIHSWQLTPKGEAI